MSLTPFLPSLIILAITVVTLACANCRHVSKHPPLVNFYWGGTWFFIGPIAAIAGSAKTMILADYDSPELAMRLKSSATLCFVIFIVFGWFRLSGATLVAGVWRIGSHRHLQPGTITE